MSTAYQLFDALPPHIEDALRASIQRFGVLVPITVDQDGNVLDGHHRRRIADELGVPHDRLVRECADDDERREIAHTLNADRRQLSEDQRREVAAHLREQGHSMRAIAGALGTSLGTVQRDLSTVSPDTVPDRIVGLDGKSRPAHRPQVIARNDREQAKAQAALPTLTGTKSTLTAAEATRAATQDRASALAVNPIALPPHQFPTIVADPPWRYDNSGTRASAESHYPTMTIEELAKLDIATRAADNAHLYLWTTNSFLREAFDITDAWGFTYKTCLTWVKPQIGLGNWFRSASEHVLFCVRGSLSTNDRSLSTWFEAPRGKHSAKPEAFYDLVERASPGPYLELFARTHRDGWQAWGADA